MCTHGLGGQSTGNGYGRTCSAADVAIGAAELNVCDGGAIKAPDRGNGRTGIYFCSFAGVSHLAAFALVVKLVAYRKPAAHAASPAIVPVGV